MGALHTACAGLLALALGSATFTAPAVAQAPAVTQAMPVNLTGLWVISNRSARGMLDADMKPVDKATIFTPKAVRIRKESAPSLDPSAHCRPGMPRQMTGPYPIQIVQTPGVVAVLLEYDNVFRLIYTDGRARREENEGGHMGRSLGHWDGDTLVVETRGVNTEVWMDPEGTPISPDLVITERFSLQEAGKTLQVVTKLEDPQTFIKPVYRKTLYNLKPDWEVMDYICASGNRDNVFAQKEGQPGSLPPPPKAAPKKAAAKKK